MSTQTSTPRGRVPRKGTDRMHVADGLHVVVRPLPSTGLEGAFRIHVLPESLEQAQLKVGDVCEIFSDDGSIGYGIAWRADDKMGNRPKNRPAKMTETARTAFGFEEGSRVTLSATDVRISTADRIVLSDVTPQEYNRPGDQDDGCWETRIKSLFMNCEALAVGVAFDVIGRRRYRRRFCIENIEARDAPADASCLFAFNDRTQVIFQDGFSDANTQNGTHATLTANTSAVTVDNTGHIRVNGSSHAPVQQHQINTDRIGGLVEQCQILNEQLQDLLDTTISLNSSDSSDINPAVLLHGYEGNGKTTMLESLAESGFRKVLRLDRTSLNGGTVAKNQTIIQDAFAEAAAQQPSLIIMDDLQALAPADDIAYAKTIANGMKTAKGKRVMIVGATRSPMSVHSSLVDPDMFSNLIELPIPDLAAREQILNILRRRPVFARDPVSSAMATRTHGFTGRDLAWLCKKASLLGYRRHKADLRQQALQRSPTPPAYDDVFPRRDASFGARPSNDNERKSSEASLGDFEQALRQVRPTALREIFIEKPQVRWSDIGGSDDVKQSFDEIVGVSQETKDMMAKLNYKPPKGVLLYGPPGCSKTLTAQAVANTYNFNFIAIKGAELISMYVGESERAVRDVFKKAKTAAPCVIFFDEIDSIGSDRDGSGTKGLNVLTTLLNEMDGFEHLTDVLILAATNKPETLDPALMRPGRFDSHVYLGPPNGAARTEIFNIATRRVPLSSDVNFDTLVAETAGYSGAEIVRLCEVAKEATMRRLGGSHPVDDVRMAAADFEAARGKVRKGITAEMLEAYEAFARRGER